MSEEKKIDKAIAAILALVVGSLGVHKFYMNNTRAGLLYLCFCWTGIPSVLALIEGIMYLVAEDEDFYQKYTDPSKIFLDIF